MGIIVINSMSSIIISSSSSIMHTSIISTNICIIVSITPGDPEATPAGPPGGTRSTSTQDKNNKQRRFNRYNSIYICTLLCIYIYIERERGREKKSH